MTDFTVAGISTFITLEEYKLHISKWGSDDTMMFKHRMASWHS